MLKHFSRASHEHASADALICCSQRCTEPKGLFVSIQSNGCKEIGDSLFE